jgi:ABC-type lipoprotein export system ATPase subunit
MISLQNVTKEYILDAENSIMPVKNVSVEVKKGEFIIIVGRSGSGKSTLLNLAAGMVKPTSGQVFFEGKDLKHLPDKELSILRNRKIGFIFQFPSLLPAFTALENVTLPRIIGNNRSHIPGEPVKAASDLLETMGLRDRAGSYPKQLSAGEQKRVVIARALVNNPPVLLADEPTSDLDMETEQAIMKLLKDINGRGVTFLMVTHSLELIPYADRAFHMENGSLIEEKLLKKGRS